MKRSGYIFLSLLLINMPALMGVEFSAKEKSIIYTNAIKVLENYQSIINQMGNYVVNDIDKAKSSSESFLELFVNRQVMIYNDLDPAHKLSEFYEAETYSSNIILWYPDGIAITLDMTNAKVSEIMTHEENVYSIDLMVKKTINGNYLNQTLNKTAEELTFRIAFGLANRSLTNFKIVGIRNAASNSVIDYSKSLKEVNSENINPEDMVKIQTELKTLLKDYTNFLSLIGDPQEPTDDKEFYKTSFTKLFQGTDTRLYNDITPEPQTSLISVADYLKGFVAAYPNGIKNLAINGDSAKFGKVMKSEEGRLYTYVEVNKFFSGSFKGKDAFRKMFPLIFKVSFNAQGKTYTGFTINSIDFSSVNFYSAAAGTEAEQKPAIEIKPVSRKGFGISLAGAYGQTQINSLNLTSLTVQKDLHSWNVTPLYGYEVTIEANYNFTDNIGLKSGFEFNKYLNKFNLNGKFTSNTLALDINSHSFYKLVDASYDSLLTINYLSIPLVINYTSGKPGKFGFYGETGLKISIPILASYSISGNYKTSGLYPAFPYPVDTLNREEDILWFSSEENISETGKIDKLGLALSFYGSVGVNIPLGYYSSINIGPEMNIGLSDISSNKRKYTDIFGKTYDHQPTKTKYFGVRICFYYKL